MQNGPNAHLTLAESYTPFNLSFRNFHNYTYPEHHGRLDTHKNVVRSDGDSFSICVCARRAADLGRRIILTTTYRWLRCGTLRRRSGWGTCAAHRASTASSVSRHANATTMLPEPGLHTTVALCHKPRSCRNLTALPPRSQRQSCGQAGPSRAAPTSPPPPGCMTMPTRS